MKQRQQTGFTLIELLVTLMIAAIIVSYAVPSVSAMIEKNRIRAHLNTFTSSFLLARSEAALRNLEVIICASDVNAFVAQDNSSVGDDEPFCDPTATDFSRGWIVFIDIDGDESRSPFADTDGDGFGDTAEPILSVSEPLGDESDPKRLMISSSRTGFEKMISFNSLGQVSGEGDTQPGSAGVGYLLHPSHNSGEVLGKMVLNNTGRPYTVCIGRASCASQ